MPEDWASRASCWYFSAMWCAVPRNLHIRTVGLIDPVIGFEPRGCYSGRAIRSADHFSCESISTRIGCPAGLRPNRITERWQERSRRPALVKPGEVKSSSPEAVPNGCHVRSGQGRIQDLCDHEPRLRASARQATTNLCVTVASRTRELGVLDRSRRTCRDTTFERRRLTPSQRPRDLSRFRKLAPASQAAASVRCLTSTSQSTLPSKRFFRRFRRTAIHRRRVAKRGARPQPQGRDAVSAPRHPAKGTRAGPWGGRPAARKSAATSASCPMPSSSTDAAGASSRGAYG